MIKTDNRDYYAIPKRHGFYWVMWEEKWIVMYWDGTQFTRPHTNKTYDLFNIKAWAEIPLPTEMKKNA